MFFCSVMNIHIARVPSLKDNVIKFESRYRYIILMEWTPLIIWAIYRIIRFSIKIKEQIMKTVSLCRAIYGE